MRTYILSVAIFCLSSGAFAQENNMMSWGGQMTRQQMAAQRREEARLAREQRRQAVEMVRQQRMLEAQQRAAARQQQIAEASAAREQARQARLAARNSRYNNSFAMSNYNPTYGDSYQSGFGSTLSGGWAGGGTSRLHGHKCSRHDTDETICRACAIYGEDRGSMGGMTAVNTVIDNRIRSGQYGSTACQVVHAPGQFVGAWHTMVDRKGILSQVEQATNSSNPHVGGATGFRSYCGKGRSRRAATGANCFGSASAEDSIPYIEVDPTMTAEQIDEQAKQNFYQFAEIFSEDNAG